VTERDPSRLWSPAMRKWMRDARQHGKNITLSHYRVRRKAGGGKGSGGGLKPQIQTAWFHVGNPLQTSIIWKGGVH